MSNNWMNMMNPFINATKRFVYDLIGPNRYTNHEAMLDQIARNFNEKEYQAFGKFVAEVFEAGYMRSVEEHQTELKKMGLKFTVKTGSSQPQPSQPIFKKNQLDNQ